MCKKHLKTNQPDEYEPSWDNLFAIYSDKKFNKKQYVRVIKVDTKQNTFILGILVSIFLGICIELANFSFLSLKEELINPNLYAFIIRLVLLLTSFLSTLFLFLYNKQCEVPQTKIELTKTIHIINHNLSRLSSESISNISFREFVNTFLEKDKIAPITQPTDKIDDAIKLKVIKSIKQSKTFLILFWIFSIVSAILLVLNFVTINGWI